MADTNISKEYKEYQERREARIMRRVKAYIAGEFTLDEFYGLERLDVDDDRFNSHKETAAELYDLNEAEEKRAQKQEAPKKAQRKEPVLPDLVNMTKEEFNALSLYEQSEYYKIAPERVREIINSDRPAYMDIIAPKPKPRDFKGTTLEDFKKMTLQEMQELYNAEPELYNKLAERLDRHTKTGSKAEAETSDVIIIDGGFISGAET